jgi:ADP-glucose pyrophosphorylase
MSQNEQVFPPPAGFSAKAHVETMAEYEAVYREFYGEAHGAGHLLADAVYGLPEIHRDEIRKARIVAFEEKPARPQPIPDKPDRALASMGIYAFNTPFLLDLLERDAADANSSHDFGRDVIPGVLDTARVFAHRFENSCVNMVGDRPYWRDVGTLDAFWEANLDLTRVVPEAAWDASTGAPAAGSTPERVPS